MVQGQGTRRSAAELGTLLWKWARAGLRAKGPCQARAEELTGWLGLGSSLGGWAGQVFCSGAPHRPTFHLMCHMLHTHACGLRVPSRAMLFEAGQVGQNPRVG